ncbi:Asp-tRNA(Asn)/Glu-tRNA(Gln) amidotransferase subunit GatB [Phycisphaerales bacterium AB-hyl4]|uniref:Aspartyl/glutamyl-tRNA(Asn/Gln) amidotransferase subunit B n=1 Tax=Natronomicrosphaera hydrolytica TaxID=3242702 RepID=A0ABV4U9L8_9BACT
MPATTTHEALKTTLKVGMEIHVQLATRSKMFTSAPNVAHPDYYDAEPNTLTDPVVLGMPGVLPVINREAVRMSIQVGLALGCRIAKRTKWDRKSYYYPDLPKNYQISQYDMPLCEEGAVEIPTSDEPGAPTKNVRIIRAHLEEDAGKLLHEGPGGAAIDHSIVDLNRAGTPLLEIVTYPDFETPEEVVMFGQTLRNICRHLGVSEGIMQKGHMRFEPNINVIIEKDGQTYKTPIVEIKNLNSFRAVYNAVAYEYERQVDEWLETGKVMASGAKSTRGWDDIKMVTVLQREKEEAHDYRYFPDPDLVELNVDAGWLDELQAIQPELPLDLQRRYVQDLGLNPKDAQALIDDPDVCRFYEKVLATDVDAKRAAALLLNYGAKRANERGVNIDDLGITPGQVKGIADLLAADKIGSSAADQLFGHCCDSDETAEALAEKHGLSQVSDTGALEGFIDQVLSDPKSAKAVEDIKAGKLKAVGALMGQIMKLSKGQANPKVVTEMIKQKLGV